MDSHTDEREADRTKRVITIIDDITVNFHSNSQGKPVVTLGRQFQHTFAMSIDEAKKVAQEILDFEQPSL